MYLLSLFKLDLTVSVPVLMGLNGNNSFHAHDKIQPMKDTLTITFTQQ